MSTNLEQIQAEANRPARWRRSLRVITPDNASVVTAFLTAAVLLVTVLLLVLAVLTFFGMNPAL